MVAKFYYMLVLQILAKFISMRHLYLFKRAWFIIYISISFFINDVASFAQDKSEFILTNITILCSIRKCFLFLKKWKAFSTIPLCHHLFQSFVLLPRLPLLPPLSPHYHHHWYRSKWSVTIYESRTLLGGCCTGVRRGCPRVGTAFELFFFFFFLLSLIRADSALICVEPGQFGQNWVVSAGDRNGRNRPKSALNHAGTAKIGFEWGPNILNLSFLNFILNICCFFCVFFFVLCFLPSSFFVLWIKA